MNNVPKISLDIVNRVSRGVVSNLLVGAGVGYALERKAYKELPLPILIPSAYAGYHLYKYRAIWAEK